MTDALGVEIKEGDCVLGLYNSGRSGITVYKQYVIGFTKSMVRVADGRYDEHGDCKAPHRLVVFEERAL